MESCAAFNGMSDPLSVTRRLILLKVPFVFTFARIEFLQAPQHDGRVQNLWVFWASRDVECGQLQIVMMGAVAGG